MLGSLKFSKDVIKQKLLCAKNGKEKEALNFAVESVNFVKRNFTNSLGSERLELVKIFHEAQTIFNYLGEKQNCFKCRKKNLINAFSTYSVLHNCKNESIEFRILCGTYLKETFDSIEALYIEKNKLYEINVLRKKFKQKYNPLILVNND